MPKFAPNTGFKMPGIGSKEIDSPGNFRDEHHVDKMGYCDNTPDDMLPKGSSPLKARYTTTGYRKDLDVIDAVDLSSLAKEPNDDKKPSGSGGNSGNTGGDTKKPPTTEKKPPPQKINPKGSLKVPELGKTKIEPNYKDITVGGNIKGKTSYSGGGTLKNQAEKDFYDKEVKRLGGVQQYRDHYKIGKKITTPGGSSSLTGKTKVKTSDKKEDIVLGGYKK